MAQVTVTGASVDAGQVTVCGTVDGRVAVVTFPLADFQALGTRAQKVQLAAQRLKAAADADGARAVDVNGAASVP